MTKSTLAIRHRILLVGLIMAAGALTACQTYENGTTQTKTTKTVETPHEKTTQTTTTERKVEDYPK